MTRDIWLSWLTAVNEDQKIRKSRILIICDNFSGHK
jgi:hypothetical protein